MIRLIKPYIEYDDVKNDFKTIFDSGWFTKGQYVQNFKTSIKEYTKATDAFLMTSATTALWVCLKILNIKPGDEVIVSDFSFPASYNVIVDLNAIPIYADVDEETYNMLPSELEKKITSRTKAVIFVDALGNPSGIDKIIEICQNNNLPLIEDAACAIGSSVNNVKCGALSDFTCFSFHPRKLLTTGEGGAITIKNNEKYSSLLKRKLEHGAEIKDGKFDFCDYGYNFRMSELQASMGIIQLTKLKQIVYDRNKIRKEFVDKLLPLGFIPQKIDCNVESNIQSLVFRVPEYIKRDSLIKELKEEGIETTIGTYSLSNTTFNKKMKREGLNNSNALFNTTITLPCYKDVPVEFIVKKIKKIMGKYR